ncbi:MAG: hypothetical protein ABI726_02510 [bacterium]
MSTDETNDGQRSDERDSEAAQVDQGKPEGVFGNLPTTRPRVPSPRRAGDLSSPPAEPEPAAGAAAEPRTGAPRGDRPGPGGGGAAERAGGGIEDVAWAGVAAAAEAATIGVRLATRALEAMRDAVEDRR